MKKIFFLFGLILVFSCESNKTQVDLFVKNGIIYTVDADFSTANAMVITDGKIVDIGDFDDLAKKYIADEMFDAKGKTIVPGLIDAHAHLFGLGMSLQQVDLVGTKSYDEVLQRTVDFQIEKQMDYILGRGWDQNDWEEKEFPTKEKLDSLFPDIPVALRRIDGHALLVNSKALELAGITAQTKMEGGEVILKNGQPTGVLVDSPMELVNKTFPETSEEVAIDALMDAQEICFQLGLTTVDDAGLDREVIDLIDKLQKEELFKLRMYVMISNTPENLEYYLEKGTYKTERLNVRSFKIYTDGALGSRGAAMKEPYSDQEGHYGAMITSENRLKEIAQKLANSDFQMNSHAIGDSANIAVLRAYSEALNGKKDRRWRVEHAQIISADDFKYFGKQNNILPSVQPTHATSDMYWAEDRIGSERIKGAYAYKDLLDKSGVIALGTDFPVEQVNPMHTFYAAVVRQDLENYPEGGFQVENALSREETLKGMTIWAAFANFEEEEKGSLEKGKFADFVVLDQDIMKVEEQELPKTKVLVTFVNGEKVHELKYPQKSAEIKE